MKKSNRLISVFLTVVMIFNVFCIGSFAKKTEPTLKFDDDGNFRIMHITDTHYTDFPFDESIEFISKALDDYKPNLVVLGGDNIKGWFDTSMQLGTKAAIDQLVAPIVERDIPFTFVYGNHDWETYLCPKQLQNRYYAKYDNCILPNGYSFGLRTSNGNILIKDSKGEKDIFNVWLFDSGTKVKSDKKTTIQCVNSAEINWYVKTSNKLKEANGGKVIPSIAFQHLGFEEVRKLFVEDENGFASGGKTYVLKSGITDTIKEGKSGIKSTQMTSYLTKSCELSTENDGQYSAFVNQGDVLGMFFGHTHSNNFCGITEDNIILGVTPSAGGFNILSRFTDADGNQVEARGLRIIDINEDALTDGDDDNLEAISTTVIYYSDYFTDSIEKYPKKFSEHDWHSFFEWFEIEFGYLFDYIKEAFTFKK